jgi:hypothetical protein
MAVTTGEPQALRRPRRKRKRTSGSRGSLAVEGGGCITMLMRLPRLIGCRTHLLQFGQALCQRGFEARPALRLTLDQGGTLRRVHGLVRIESEARFDGLAPSHDGARTRWSEPVDRANPVGRDVQRGFDTE